MAGEEGLIDPSAILIPKLKADALEGTASDLVGDGEAISTSGDDIKSNWAGLQEVYSAPEAETLFSAVDPVAATGDDIEDALAKVGDALTSFAQEARKTKQRLKELKDEAETFVKSVEGDPNWRADQEKVDRHEALRIDINHQTRNYQNWERVCANDITSIFGGTHFVGRDPKNPQICKPGEQFYGVNYIPENAAMPWGAPQEVDKPFWAEGIDAVKDYGISWFEGVGVIGKNIVGDRGLVYPFSPEWRDNVPGQLKGGLAFGFSLTGFYDYRTQDGGLFDWSAGSAANAWKELGNAFVPLSESDRPGYVFTQAVLNIGTLGIGVAPKLGKIARMGSDVPSHGGNGPDLTQHVPDPSNPSHPANPAHMPSVQELQNQLDKLEQQTFEHYSPTGAMDVVDDIPMREHAMSGGLDIQTNANDPKGSGDLPPTNTGPQDSSGHSQSSTGQGADHPSTPDGKSSGSPDFGVRGQATAPDISGLDVKLTHDSSSGAPPAPQKPDLEGSPSSPSQFSEYGRPARAPGPMPDEQEATIKTELQQLKLKPADISRITENLQKSAYGNELASNISKGNLSGIPGFHKVLTDIKNVHLQPASNMAMRFANELTNQGVQARELEFERGDSPEYDLDLTTVRADGTPHTGYQFKDLNGTRKIVKRALGGVDQLMDNRLEKRVSIIDVHSSVGTMPRQKLEELKDISETYSVTFQLRFEDGNFTIPSSGNIYP